MALANFDSLTPELIAHIASSLDALSVLNLSGTSKVIRAACYKEFIFRDILAMSQLASWDVNCLDMDAIARRAGNDVSVWARYAVADQKAHELALSESNLETPQRFLAWLPELFVARHPFMYEERWRGLLQQPIEMSLEHAFCLALAMLATQVLVPQLDVIRYPHDMANSLAGGGGDDKGANEVLWDLSHLVPRLPRLQLTGGRVGRFSDEAIVPHIPIPQASKIHMLELRFPVPFTHTWDQWYRQYCHAMLQSSTFLFDGTWRGYYTDDRFSSDELDPPMVDIQFTRVGTGEEIVVLAQNCLDGIGRFQVKGRFRLDDHRCQFLGQKRYQYAINWEWRLQLTMFGFVGGWGVEANGRFVSYGKVWLWKTA